MSTERRERLPVSVSAAVFIENHEGRLLLLQQAAERKGYKWGPPAGGMEAHEDPIETAHRETREEIGVEVEILNLLGIYTVDRGETATGIAFVFRGRIVSGEIRLRPGEIDTYRYFTKDEVRSLIEKSQIYKPEYNQPGIEDWINGISFSTEVLRPFVT